METERGSKAESEMSGQSTWIALDDTTPHVRRASCLPEDSNSLMPDHFVHGEVAMPRSPTLEDDLALIGRVVGGNRQAFETLYHRYAPVVYRYLWKLIRQREIVEEAFNDVMMVVWETASRFNGTSRLSTWILGIAHYKALKALRGRTANFDANVRETDPDGVEIDGVETIGPEDAVAHRELASSVTRALDSLSLEQRAVVELTYYHGLSYAEIAEILRCPVNTVKTRMLYARRRLQSLLAGDWENHDKKKEPGRYARPK
jgi:RNA polymerase sigma factor (sigma-70 family)